MGGGSMQKTLPRAAEPRIIRAERHAGYARSWADSKGLFLRPQGTVGRFRLMSMYSTPGQRACGLQRAWLRNPGAAGGQVLAEPAEGVSGTKPGATSWWQRPLSVCSFVTWQLGLRLPGQYPSWES